MKIYCDGTSKEHHSLRYGAWACVIEDDLNKRRIVPGYGASVSSSSAELNAIITALKEVNKLKAKSGAVNVFTDFLPAVEVLTTGDYSHTKDAPMYRSITERIESLRKRGCYVTITHLSNEHKGIKAAHDAARLHLSNMLNQNGIDDCDMVEGQSFTIAGKRYTVQGGLPVLFEPPAAQFGGQTFFVENKTLPAEGLAKVRIAEDFSIYINEVFIAKIPPVLLHLETVEAPKKEKRTMTNEAVSAWHEANPPSIAGLHLILAKATKDLAPQLAQAEAVGIRQVLSTLIHNDLASSIEWANNIKADTQAPFDRQGIALVILCLLAKVNDKSGKEEMLNTLIGAIEENE